MKTSIAILMLTATISVIAEPKIEVMPELMKQVNAFTEGNSIPWHKPGDYQVMVVAQLNDIVPLVRTTHGDYHYTLNRIRFHSVKVLEGELSEKELSFYFEHDFPTPESGIKRDDFWPFQKGCIRIFKLRKEKDRLRIVSIEMKEETQHHPAPYPEPLTVQER